MEIRLVVEKPQKRLLRVICRSMQRNWWWRLGVGNLYWLLVRSRKHESNRLVSLGLITLIAISWMVVLVNLT